MSDKYKATHKYEISISGKAYYQANKEKIKANVEAYRQKNREKIAEYKKNRVITNAQKENMSAWWKKYRKLPNVSIKRRARGILQNNVDRGKIFKQPCEICGELKVDGHHEDYSKPLEVNWLCRKHHSELHKKYNGRTKTR